MNRRRLLTTAAAAAAGVLALPATAQAHHPVLAVTTPCRQPDQPWTATWTATSDGTWTPTVQVLTPGWTPTGWQPVDTEFTLTTSHPADRLTATVHLTLLWDNNVQAGAEGTASRPALCVPDTTTTTTTTTVPPATEPPATDPPTTTTTTTTPASSTPSTVTSPSSTSSSTTSPVTTTPVTTSISTTSVAVDALPLPEPYDVDEPPVLTVDWLNDPDDIVVHTTDTLVPAQALPATGSSDTDMIIAAVALLLAGTVAVAVARRKQAQ